MLQVKIDDKDHKKLWICDQHFTTNQMWIYSDRKKLKEGELPTLNLPVKNTFTSPPALPRSSISIQKREECRRQIEVSTSTIPNAYKDFSDFKNRVLKLSLGDIWKVETVAENLVYAIFKTQEYVLPKFEIFVEDSLLFTVRVFGWMLPEDHEVYKKYGRSFFNMTFSNFILELGKSQLCPGIQIPDPVKASYFQKHLTISVFLILHQNQLPSNCISSK